MNNKEFIDYISTELSIDNDTAQEGVAAIGKALVEMLDDQTMLSIKGFGTFEVRKRIERVAMNPATQQKMLVPPKLAISFKPSPSLKDKVTSTE